MSRHIFCPKCNKRYVDLARQYGELYESIEGESIGEFFCDGCSKPNPIHPGDICFAAVLLPNEKHFNYPIQKPEAWMGEYITPVNKTV